MLAAQEGAGAAHAGLHLVHDEHKVFFVAQSAHGLYIVRVQRHHAALTLNQFHHHGAGVAVHQFLQRFDIPRRDVLEAFVEGAEVVVEHLLPGGGQGGKGAAMEAVDQRDNVVAVLAVMVYAVLAGGLDGASLASAPELPKKTLLMPVRLHSFFASLPQGAV